MNSIAPPFVYQPLSNMSKPCWSQMKLLFIESKRKTTQFPPPQRHYYPKKYLECLFCSILVCVNPSIFSPLLPFQGHWGVLEPFPSWQGQHADRPPFTLTPTVILEESVHQTPKCTSWDCGRKLEYPDGTHANFLESCFSSWGPDAPQGSHQKQK